MRITREAQRNIFLTTKEAINNCVKHAGASEINICLSIDNSILSILVCDNGKGFDITQPKSGGNGLRNMKQRIQLDGGMFSIQSVPGGTTVSITIPFEHLSSIKIPL